MRNWTRNAFIVGSRAAFTLIELMVVMAVIALLGALLLPTIHRVKSRVQTGVCSNNLRQWGLATHQFASEHEDLLPKDGAPNGTSIREGWYVDLPRNLGLAPYVQMSWRTNAAEEPDRCLWTCPANKRRSNGLNLFHYCLNQNINRAGSGNQVTLASVPDPSRAVWLFDNGKLAAVAQQNNVHSNLHTGGAQFLFLDGHVAWFQARDYWDAARNRGRTDFPDLRWNP